MLSLNNCPSAVRIRLINLDATPQRLATFTKTNAHLPDVSRFAAIDGTTVNRAELAERKLLTPGLGYSDGALGNALSHLSLWNEAIVLQRPVTVCEDDAIFSLHFTAHAPAMLGAIEADWDIIYWGWNFDAFTMFDIMPGVSTMLAQFNQDELRAGLDHFRSARFNPRLVRLLAAFGSICYSISPKGAKTLINACFPLKDSVIRFPIAEYTMANVALDVVMAGLLSDLRAFASFPPLVVTSNDKSSSTVFVNQAS